MISLFIYNFHFHLIFLELPYSIILYYNSIWTSVYYFCIVTSNQIIYLFIYCESWLTNNPPYDDNGSTVSILEQFFPPKIISHFCQIADIKYNFIGSIE